MKSVILLVVVCTCAFCFIRCTKNTPDSFAEQKTASICSVGDLQFDEVEAYTISYKDLQVIESHKPQSENDKLLDRIVSYYPIDNLKQADSALLVEIGFTSKKINTEDYQYLCDLFQEKFVYEDTMACQAVFRDILLY